MPILDPTKHVKFEPVLDRSYHEELGKTIAYFFYLFRKVHFHFLFLTFKHFQWEFEVLHILNNASRSRTNQKV